jgi:hypothetical protein
LDLEFSAEKDKKKIKSPKSKKDKTKKTEEPQYKNPVYKKDKSNVGVLGFN